MKAIYAAFIQAQKEFGPALKTSTNPHFRSRYADLSACVEAVIDALNNNGIGLIQATHECSDGVIVETVLIHESGENMTFGKLHVPASKHDAQGYGSALTYARRYSLMAACGIAPEDDDGNNAVKASRKPVAQVSTADDLPDWSKIEKAVRDEERALKKDTSKTRMVKTQYDIRTLAEDSQTKAVKYLKEHACSYDETTGYWTCPIILERLTGCIVKESNEKERNT